MWPSPFQVCTSLSIPKGVQQGVDASTVKKTHEGKPTRPMEAKEGESYMDTLIRHVINQDIDLDESFGFSGGTYASPPYTLLPPTTFTIRILILLPGNFNDDIRGFLVAIPLDSKPEYMALSYVWGDAKDTVPIFLNGQEVFVTKNLASALRQLRDPTGLYKIWADALCINQTDAIEKSSQVAQMGKIYQNAAEVIVWLGQDEEKSQDNWQGSAERTRSAFEFARSLASPSPADDTVLTSQDEKYPEEDSGLRAFINLLCRDWFSRRWVIQEVLLPDISKVRAVCGCRGIAWIVLRAAAQKLQAHIAFGSPSPPLNLAMKAGPSHLLLLEAMRLVKDKSSFSAQHPGRTLCALLLSVGGKLQATDRRDRIQQNCVLLGRNRSWDYHGSWGKLPKTTMAPGTRDILGKGC
jgi:Heterokaryon incompatibility protein (HET)